MNATTLSKEFTENSEWGNSTYRVYYEKNNGRCGSFCSNGIFMESHLNNGAFAPNVFPEDKKGAEWRSCTIIPIELDQENSDVVFSSDPRSYADSH